MKPSSRVVAILIALCANYTFAGGPLLVGSPTKGVQGQPFVWDVAAMPIQYRVDTGAMSVNPSGTTVISNQQGLGRLQSMVGVWQNVPTAAVSFNYAGPLIASGNFGGGHVATVADFNDVVASCKSGVQTPIIFDGNGSIFAALGLDQDVIGFAAPCNFSGAGKIVNAYAMLNGQMQDGVSSSTNPEMPPAAFDQAMVHELGHFLGLDHSQINLQTFTSFNFTNCPADALAGLPVMFPVSFCQARIPAGLPPLAPDDIAWISKLYPNATTQTSYGTISGYILFSDGLSHMQGVNVIARRVDDPDTAQDESLSIAFSVVSGHLFTGNPGQSITAKYLACSPADKCPGGFADNNAGGSSYGSRDATVIGYYEIPVLPGSYTVQVESVYQAFEGGSSVGPLDPPIPMPGPAEFWHQNESASDDPSKKDPVNVAAGQTVSNINIIVNNTPPRYDQFEDGISTNFGVDVVADIATRRRWNQWLEAGL